MDIEDAPKEQLSSQEQPLSAVIESKETVDVCTLCAPLFSKLIDAGISLQSNQFEFPFRAREIIEAHCNDVDFSMLKRDFSDLVFLLSTPIGNMLRRPVLFGSLIDAMIAMPPEGREQAAIYLAVEENLYSHAYERFLPPDEIAFTGESWPVSTQTWEERMSVFWKDIEYTVDLHRHLQLHNEPILECFDVLTDAYGSVGHQWFCDPGHGLEAVWYVQESLSGILTAKGSGRVIADRLSRPVSFMFLEDSYGYFWETFFSLNENNFVPFSESGYREDRGHFNGFRYFNTALPLRDIEDRGEFPEVVLTDVELSTPGVGDGLDFAEDVRSLALNKGIKPPIVFAYTSNFERHRAYADGLLQEGVLAGYFDKRSFRPNDFVRALNSRL